MKRGGDGRPLLRYVEKVFVAISALNFHRFDYVSQTNRALPPTPRLRAGCYTVVYSGL